MHNTSSKAAAALSEMTGFDVEDLAVDVSYWFDKSTKRKAGLEEFCVLCDTTYKEVVSRVNTLAKPSLAIYLMSLKHQHDLIVFENFSDPITEVYLIHHSVIPHKLLQRGDPVIFLSIQR